MKRKTSTLDTQIWAFGAFFPKDNAELFFKQLQASHQYRNALVEVERNNRQAFRDQREPALTNHEQYNQLNQAYLQVSEKLKEAREQIKTLRKTSRKRVTTVFLQRTTDELKKQLKEISTERKKIVSAINKEIQQTFQDRRREQEKKTRKESPLFWGTKGLVEQAHEAVKKKRGEDPQFVRRAPMGHHDTKILKHFKDQPELGLYRGRVGIQVMGTVTVQDIFDGKCKVFQLDPVPQDAYGLPGARRRKRMAQTEARVRIGSEGPGGLTPVWAKFNVILHRQLPPTARVKWVWILTKKTNRHLRHELQISLEYDFSRYRNDKGLLVPDTRPQQGTIAINLGWRQKDDGQIRVAYGVDDRGKRREFLLPAKFHWYRQRPTELEAIRDKEFNVILPMIQTWVAKHALPEALTEATSHIDQWKSKNRLAHLTFLWSQCRFPGDEEIFAAIEVWRKRDRHLCLWAQDIRSKHIEHRKYIFKRWTFELGTYDTIIVDDSDHTAFLKNVNPEQEQYTEKNQKRNQTTAASATFRRTLQNKYKSRVILAPSPNITRKHNRCGHTEERTPDLIQTCSACTAQFDMDENAALNLLQGSSGQDVAAAVQG